MSLLIPNSTPAERRRGAIYSELFESNQNVLANNVVVTDVSVSDNKGTFAVSTSKLQPYLDFDGTGDITVMARINIASFGGANAGRIIDNGKLRFVVFSSSSRLAATSDGSATNVYSGNNSISLNTDYHVAITRTSAGVMNFYVDGVLSGTANQASGTPEAGSATLTIGNDSGSTREFDGTMSEYKIFNKILTAQEISDILLSFEYISSSISDY